MSFFGAWQSVPTRTLCCERRAPLKLVRRVIAQKACAQKGRLARLFLCHRPRLVRRKWSVHPGSSAPPLARLARPRPLKLVRRPKEPAQASLRLQWRTTSVVLRCLVASCNMCMVRARPMRPRQSGRFCQIAVRECRSPRKRESTCTWRAMASRACVATVRLQAPSSRTARPRRPRAIEQSSRSATV